MKEPQLIVEPYPPAAWNETVIRGVDQHNIAVTGLSDYYPVGFFVLGPRREILAGLLGDIWGGGMLVGSLWVSPALRGRGYGAALMHRAHRYAIEKSCTRAFLRTGSYEARPFYEKLGYQVYAELEDHPRAPHARYFLECALDSASESEPPKTKLAIVMDPYYSDDARNTVRGGISSHAHAAIGLPETEWYPHNVFVRAHSGEIVGGALGNLWSEWLYIDYVWIDRPLRGRGYASRMVTMAEQSALARGCVNASLSTFSFQARPLYEKLGYHVFGEQKDFPPGHTHYHLTKRLRT